jgi:hypothetical protein
MEEQEKEEMSASHTDEVAPQVFKLLDRTQAELPEHCLSEATAVVVASPDLIRGLDDFTNSSWRPNLYGDGFDRALPEERRILRVRQFGQFWYIQRLCFDDYGLDQALVFPFDNVPICTRTCEEAMRLAEHCSPMPHSPVMGCWVKLERVRGP